MVTYFSKPRVKFIYNSRNRKIIIQVNACIKKNIYLEVEATDDIFALIDVQYA